jgi:hypothetical protein
MISVTFFENKFARTKREGEYQLADLVDMILNANATGPTPDEAKNRMRLLKLARFGDHKDPKSGALRNDKNMIALTGVEFDYDGGTVSFEAGCQILREAGIQGIAYTSPRHSATVAKWRILCPFSRELPLNQHHQMVARLNGLYDGIFDPVCFTLSQSYYYSSINGNPLHQAVLIDGTPLDLHHELDKGARGKTRGGTVEKGGQHGAYDEAGLIKQMMSSESYHPAAKDLLARWAWEGRSFAEASDAIKAIFDAVPEDKRDERWHDRRKGMLPLIKWFYDREGEKRSAKQKMNGSTSHPAEEPEGDPGRDHAEWSEPIDAASLLKPAPWRWRDPRTIPPRRWLLGNVLLRRHTTILSSQGGAGKTTYAIGASLSVITGKRSILGLHSFVQGPVWYLTLEDDVEELERRIHAAMIHHKLDPADIEDRLYLNHPELALLELDSNRLAVRTNAVPAMIEHINEHDILLVVIDPLVKAHRVIENSNEHMDELIKTTNLMARQSDAACLLPAHFRKAAAGGSNGADPEQTRGASSLVWGARISLNITPMTKEEGDSAPVENHRAYFKVHDAKTNFTLKLGDIGWFELHSIPLGNADEAYPEGDHVQACAPWTPPDAFDGMSPNILRAIFDILGKEIRKDLCYSPSPNSEEWAGKVIMNIAGKSAAEAKAIMKKWQANEVFSTELYWKNRKSHVKKIVVNPEAVAEMIAASCPPEADLRQGEAHEE